MLRRDIGELASRGSQIIAISATGLVFLALNTIPPCRGVWDRCRRVHRGVNPSIIRHRSKNPDFPALLHGSDVSHSVGPAATIGWECPKSRLVFGRAHFVYLLVERSAEGGHARKPAALCFAFTPAQAFWRRLRKRVLLRRARPHYPRQVINATFSRNSSLLLRWCIRGRIDRRTWDGASYRRVLASAPAPTGKSGAARISRVVFYQRGKTSSLVACRRWQSARCAARVLRYSFSIARYDWSAAALAMSSSLVTT